MQPGATARTLEAPPHHCYTEDDLLKKVIRVLGGCEQAGSERALLDPVSWSQINQAQVAAGSLGCFCEWAKRRLLSERKELTVGRYAGWTPASG